MHYKSHKGRESHKYSYTYYYLLLYFHHHSLNKTVSIHSHLQLNTFLYIYCNLFYSKHSIVKKRSNLNNVFKQKCLKNKKQSSNLECVSNPNCFTCFKNSATFKFGMRQIQIVLKVFKKIVQLLNQECAGDRQS